MGWLLTAGDGPKQVHLQVRSVSGLESIVYHAETTLDTTAPTASMMINDGAPSTGSTTVHLTLTFLDSGTGVKEMMIAEDEGFTGSSWQEPNETLAWELTEGDGIKRLYLKVVDFAGWESETAFSETFLDTTPPMCTVAINDDDSYTTSAAVTISMAFGDEGAGVGGLRISQRPDLSLAEWTGPTGSLTLTLEPGDGLKSVYLQVRDLVGWVSGTASDTIVLDTVPPSASIEINGGDELTNSTTVRLDLSFEDETSGPTRMRLSADANFTGAVHTRGRGAEAVPPSDGRRGPRLGTRIGQHHHRDPSPLGDGVHART
jgi:hypothetical protein